MQAITFKPLIIYPKIRIAFPSISLKGVKGVDFSVDFMKKLYRKSVLYHFVNILTSQVE